MDGKISQKRLSSREVDKFIDELKPRSEKLSPQSRIHLVAALSLATNLLTGCLPEGKEKSELEDQAKLMTASLSSSGSSGIVSISSSQQRSEPKEEEHHSGSSNSSPSPTPTASPSASPTATPMASPSASPSPSPVNITTAESQTTSTIAPAVTPSSSASTSTTAEIMVNNGERFTSVLDVIVNIHRDFTPEMKVTQSETCDGGVWETYAPTKNIHLGLANSINNVSVQFRDYDKNVSECFVTQVVHDNIPPQVNVSGLLSVVTVNTPSTIAISVSDSGSGIKESTCTLNSAPISCLTTSIPNSNIGAQSLVVTAKDRTGNQTVSTTSWIVQELPPELRVHRLAMKVQSNTKADILFVIDNSGSMQYEQQSMARRINNFINTISQLDWRIGVTTTDPDHPVWGDGRLVKMKLMSNDYVLQNNLPADRLQEILGKTIQREEVGSGSEQGIRASYRALERSTEVPKQGQRNPNRELFRDVANLSIVLISDENESAHSTKNDPAQLVKFVKTKWPHKKFNFHSIITRPNDVACLKSYGASYGKAYMEISNMLGFGQPGGSIIGDVCAMDYTSQLKGIGHAVVDMQKVIKLDCVPQGDLSRDITILHDGANFTEPFTVDGANLVFSDALPIGTYELQFLCK